MARTSQQISESIRAKLKLIDPDISTEPLTPERKIIDTVAETIAEAEIDNFVLNYQMDIDTKIGADLDKFVALFGFARQGGRRATGTVTFSRATAAERDIVIPVGTQVIKPQSSISNVVIFQTTATVFMYKGTTEVEAPIECTTSGPIGNQPAGVIIAMTTGGAVSDVTSVRNENATSGGTNIESDAELRIRFKNTIFRNITGTQDQYLALAISSKFSKKANVIGPQSRFIEYLQVANSKPTTGQTGAISIIPYSKYTYSTDYYLTDGEVGNETFYTPEGAHYTFNATVPPSFTVNSTSVLPVNKVLLLEHVYCSANSRNDPPNGIANFVDIYVSGQNIIDGIETCAFPSLSANIVGGYGTKYAEANFRRYEDNSTPVVGNRVQELLWQPVISLPSVISINGNNYSLNTHYWLLRDISTYKGSKRARNAIEWSSSVSAAVTAGTIFEMTYNFDKLPLTINELVDAHKQITTDVLVHGAQERYFNVNLIIMYTPGFSTVAVDTAISTALAD